MEITLEDLQDALQRASGPVLRFLRSEPDVDALTPGGEWTVRDTAVHLIIGARAYKSFVNGHPSPLQSRDDMDVINAQALLLIDERQPAILADLVEEATASFLRATSRHGRDDPCPYNLGTTRSVGLLTATLCNEYLLDGADMTRAVGGEWSCPESAASTTLAVYIPQFLLVTFDPEAAADLNTSYALQSPDTRICFRVLDGAIVLLDVGADTDCTIDGPSSRILLWVSKRTGWEDAGLSASGPHPDLAPSLVELLKRV